MLKFVILLSDWVVTATPPYPEPVVFTSDLSLTILVPDKLVPKYTSSLTGPQEASFLLFISRLKPDDEFLHTPQYALNSK